MYENFRSNVKKQIKTLKINTSCFWFLRVYNTWVILSKFGRGSCLVNSNVLRMKRFLFTRKRTIGMKLASVRVTIGHFFSGENKTYHVSFQPNILVWHSWKVTESKCTLIALKVCSVKVSTAQFLHRTEISLLTI